MFHKILPSILAASMALAPIITQAKTTDTPKDNNSISQKKTNIPNASNATPTHNVNPKNNNISNTATTAHIDLINITIQKQNPTTQEYDTTLANVNIPINDTNNTANQPQKFSQEERVSVNNTSNEYTNTTISKISGQMIHDTRMNTTTISLAIVQAIHHQYKNDEMSVDIPYVTTYNIQGTLTKTHETLTFFNKDNKYRITVTNKQLPATPAK